MDGEKEALAARGVGVDEARAQTRGLREFRKI